MIEDPESNHESIGQTNVARATARVSAKFITIAIDQKKSFFEIKLGVEVTVCNF